MADLIPNEAAAGRDPPDCEFFLATVESYNDYNEPKGVSLVFDGETEATTKRFKRIATSTSLSRGDRVLVIKVGGTYIVVGKVGYSRS